jgi:hypothetical protein
VLSKLYLECIGVGTEETSISNIILFLALTCLDMDWNEIVNYILLCILYGQRYQAFICVSILKYLEREIIHHSAEKDLPMFLTTNPLQGYRLTNWMPFIYKLYQNEDYHTADDAGQ